VHVVDDPLPHGDVYLFSQQLARWVVRLFTGVVMVTGAELDDVIIVSASVDQRLCVWSLRLADDCTSIRVCVVLLPLATTAAASGVYIKKVIKVARTRLPSVGFRN